jgi:hypothetical protein
MKKEFSRVAEAVIAQCQPSHYVVRNVIKKDHPQSDTAEEIEPEIAFDGGEESYRIPVKRVALHLLGVAVLRC